MKTFKYSALLALGLSATALAQNVTVNPGSGSYLTVKAAFDAINAGTHTGAITIDVVANTTEPASAVLNASGSGAANYSSILMRPSGGAFSVSGVIDAFPLIDLNGADNVTIDGLSDGVNLLTLSNTSVSTSSLTSTIRFVGGASNNIVRNSVIQASSPATLTANTAAVFFSTDTVTAQGNDNNQIRNNSIRPAGTNLPTKAIYCNGSGSAAATNSGNIIDGNNIFDYFNPASASWGVLVNNGCNTMTISNNRFFQTGTRTWTAGANHRPIEVGSTSAGSGAQGMVISGNRIGFANSTGTGTYILTGSSGKFMGIVLNAMRTSDAAVGSTNLISNNVIANISLSTTASGISNPTSGTVSNSPLMGIYINAGPAQIIGNTIGDMNQTGSIVFAGNTTTATDIAAIIVAPSNGDNATVALNNIGGMTLSNSASSSAAYGLHGIRISPFVSGAIYTVEDNTVGGTIVDSIQNTSSGLLGQMTGISMAAGTAGNTCTLRANRNLLRNMSYAGGGGFHAIQIGSSSAGGPHLITRNTIQAIKSTSVAGNINMFGILHQAAGSTSSDISRNTISGISAVTTSVTALIVGTDNGLGNANHRNNMIRLGRDGAEADVTAGIQFIGMRERFGSNNYQNNSVRIQGSDVLGSQNSFAFNSTQTGSTRLYQNNILLNERGNSGAGTGKHYAITVPGSTLPITGLTSNRNVLRATGVNGFVGFFAGNDRVSLSDWQTATTQDANSINGDPLFVSATDLRLTPGSAAIDAGEVIAAVTVDIDGEARPGGNALYDIGADERDGAPPINADIAATAMVSPASGGLRGAGIAFVPSASFSNSGQNNQTNVTVRYRILDAGSVVVYNQTAVIPVSVTLQSQTVAFPAATISTTGNYTVQFSAELVGDQNTTNDVGNGTLTILAPLGGTVNVGVGNALTSLTNAGGVFENLNLTGASSNLTLNITSDLTSETGLNALNELASGITLTIQPSGAARTISGSSAGALLRFNGTDNVTIQGSTTGAQAADIVGGNDAFRQLTIANSGTGASVVQGISGANGARNFQVRNVKLVGPGAESPSLNEFYGVAIGGATTGSQGVDNDGFVVDNCSFRSLSRGVVSLGQNRANQNVGGQVTRNDMTGTGSDRVRNTGIWMNHHDGANVSMNNIANLLTTASESNDIAGILAGINSSFVFDSATVGTTDGLSNSTIVRNQIDNLNSVTSFGGSAAGIMVGTATGTNVVANNMISRVISQPTGVDFTVGLGIVGNATAGTTQVHHNSVSLSGVRSALAAQSRSYAAALLGGDSIINLSNNIFRNEQSAPSGAGLNALSYALGSTQTTFANLSNNFNVYFTSGASALFIRTGLLGTAGTETLHANLGVWQTSSADEANSLSADPLLTSLSDLHLTATSPANNVGTPIAGVTVDLDNDPRSAITPDIGADEFTAGNTAPTITPTAAGLTRQQGSPASNGQIAVVADAEQALTSLVVTAPTVPSLLTASTISAPSAMGAVTANVAAACTAPLGASTVGLSVTDGSLTGAGNLTVNVTANTAPTQGTYANITANTGLSTSATPSAAPTDNGTVALATAVATGTNTFTGSLSVNPSTGVVTITNPGPAGSYTVTVTTTDNCDVSSTATFTLTVSNSNAAPTIAAQAGVSRQQGSAGTVGQIATVTDDGGAANVTVTVNGGATASVNGVTVASIANVNGTINANVVAACNATAAAFTLTATDGGALTATSTLNVAVAANTPPVLGTYSPLTLPATFGGTVNPSAAPNDNGTVVTLAAAGSGVFSGSASVTSAGVLTLTNVGPVGGYTITVTATDNCSLTSTATLALTVGAEVIFRNGFEDPIVQVAAPAVGQSASTTIPTAALTAFGSLGSNLVTVVRIQVGSDTYALQMRGDGAAREVRIKQENGAFTTPWIPVAGLGNLNFGVSNIGGQLVLTLR